MPKDDYERYLAALTKKRRPAIEQAQRLLEDDRFEEAERAIMSVDDSIYGHVAVARLYRDTLMQLAEREPCNRARLEAYFERAEHWFHSAYPDPHTLIEAEDFEQGRKDETAELVRILGYHPKGGA
ncbi:MAG: hypothetical protein R3C45_01820 [Phycisphaerales bacterium]